jgi:hypothetical protein
MRFICDKWMVGRPSITAQVSGSPGAIPIFAARVSSLAVATAVAVLAMMRRGVATKSIAIALLVVHIAVSVSAHPDYFPYFNVMPARIKRYAHEHRTPCRYASNVMPVCIERQPVGIKRHD